MHERLLEVVNVLQWGYESMSHLDEIIKYLAIYNLYVVIRRYLVGRRSSGLQKYSDKVSLHLSSVDLDEMRIWSRCNCYSN